MWVSDGVIFWSRIEWGNGGGVLVFLGNEGVTGG